MGNSEPESKGHEETVGQPGETFVPSSDKVDQEITTAVPDKPASTKEASEEDVQDLHSRHLVSPDRNDASDDDDWVPEDLSTNYDGSGSENESSVENTNEVSLTVSTRSVSRAREEVLMNNKVSPGPIDLETSISPPREDARVTAGRDAIAKRDWLTVGPRRSEAEDTRLLNMQMRLLKRDFEQIRGGVEQDRPTKRQKKTSEQMEEEAAVLAKLQTFGSEGIVEDDRIMTKQQRYLRERLDLNLRERERLLRQYRELQEEEGPQEV